MRYNAENVGTGGIGAPQTPPPEGIFGMRGLDHFVINHLFPSDYPVLFHEETEGVWADLYYRDCMYLPLILSVSIVLPSAHE